MSVTEWERRKAISSVLRGIWDTKRDGVETWEQSFAAARDELLKKMARDVVFAREMTWEEFQRLQEWRNLPADDTGAQP